MRKIFDDVDELFDFSESRRSTVTLQGMLKSSADDLMAVLFAPLGCEDWLSLSKDSIKEIEFLYEAPCKKEGEEPHTHPFVRLALDSSEPAIRIIAKLTNELTSTRSRQRSLRLDSSPRDDCEFGAGSCGQWNPDIGDYCSPESRPCFEDGYVWCKDFAECGRLTHGSLGPRGIPVGGNAGNCTDVWYDGKCYLARNRCSQKVKVELGPWSAPVNPGETFKFTGFGNCFSTYVGPTVSNFV